MTEHEIAGWFQLGLWGCFWVVVGALAVKLLYHVLDDPVKRETDPVKRETDPVKRETDKNGFTQHDWQCILPIIRLKSESRRYDLAMRLAISRANNEPMDWTSYLMADVDIVQETIDEWKETKRQMGK